MKTLTLKTAFVISVFSLVYGMNATSVVADEATTDTASIDTAKSEEWDVATPAVPADTLRFTFNEGTWISVDVHPDGSRMVFDLLGDIFTMPIGGGEAVLLSGGLPYEIQPRYSPDGNRILFTSDRGGGDNIWVMDADGTNRHAVTNEDFRLLNNGTWHPDGEYIIARKHFTSRRSMGAGEMWLYRLSDGGEGVQLTKRKNDQQDAGEPEFSPDGHYLYWSEDMSGGDYFEYNKDPNQTIYVIRRLDMETGEIRDAIRLPGGAVRPQVSPDGKTLAFVRRVRAKSVLCLHDLSSGEIRQLWDGLDKDQQETWAIFGVYPGFDWTPDGKSIVIWAQGKIWRVEVTTGKPTEIPFSVNVEQTVAKALRFPPDVGGPQFPVKVIRWPQVTPDCNKVIFQALGYLYEYVVSKHQRRRLTNQTAEYEFAPSISPGGRRIAYVTWNDRAGGRVKIMNLDGRSVRTVVDEPGHYVSATISPDGKQLVYHRGRGDGFRGNIWDDEPGIYLVNIEGGQKARLLTREGGEPRFNRDGQRVYLVSSENDQRALISLNLLGSDRRVHAVSERAGDFYLSPDERWLAFEELWQTYVVPFPQTSTPIAVGPKMQNLPLRRLSENGGTYLSWSPDSRTVRWSLGPELSSIDLDSLYSSAPGADNSGEDTRQTAEEEKSRPHVIDLSWQEDADIPATDLYLTGGTILPMNDLSTIPNGVIHIKENRIAEVVTADEITIPAGAKTLDISGTTVIPGFVDIHSHVWSSNQGVYPQQNWGLLANLAFGVTTIQDPSNNSQMIFAEAELGRAGTLISPRIFSTGTILYGAEGDFKTVIDTYDDALQAVKRTIAWGANSVKSYNQPRRNQRQMVIKAGYELKTMVIPEGGSALHLNMTQLLDGHTTLEHAIPVAPLYDPELRLLGRFGSGYTPTLVVGYGGLWGENYWYEHTNVWENERLARFVPRWVIDPRARRREMAPREEYHHFLLAATAADVVHRGGNVHIGSHGQMQGLAAHWDLWMLAQGGLTNHEALRAATWMGARALGMDGQLGSLQPGMLADLLVIDGDPVADIRQSENIRYTMLNGRLYDARTMDQLEPVTTPLPPGPFTDEVTRSHIGAGCLDD